MHFGKLYLWAYPFSSNNYSLLPSPYAYYKTYFTELISLSLVDKTLAPAVCIVIFTNEIKNHDLLHHKPLPVFLLLSLMTTNNTETEATTPIITPTTTPPARLTPTVVYDINDEHSSKKGHVLPHNSVRNGAIVS